MQSIQPCSWDSVGVNGRTHNCSNHATGNVPMTSRFLIAAVAGYVILAIVFLIDNTLPDQQEG